MATHPIRYNVFAHSFMYLANSPHNIFIQLWCSFDDLTGGVNVLAVQLIETGGKSHVPQVLCMIVAGVSGSIHTPHLDTSSAGIWCVQSRRWDRPAPPPPIRQHPTTHPHQHLSYGVQRSCFGTGFSSNKSVSDTVRVGCSVCSDI